MDEIAKSHHVRLAWEGVMARIRQHLRERGVHPSGTVVLVPFAQLIPVARDAWLHSMDAHASRAYFMPRFETTLNWTKSLAGFASTGDDLTLDAARDALTAASLLERAGLAAHPSALTGRLMEAAWSLARVAAAIDPGKRSAWGMEQALLMGAQVTPVLELEARIGQTALAWVANSAYPTDRLFAAKVDLLVLLEGLQPEPLHEALRALHGGRVVALRLHQPAEVGDIRLHQAQDVEDEAERAAACVLNHLEQGRAPVALVAQDRILTRRVRALLAERGVVLRDETGWTLSTTRAAATVMGLLRAAAWDVSTDAVLDWAKNAPALDANALALLEASLRRGGIRDWRAVPAEDPTTLEIQALRNSLQKKRELVEWLQALRVALRGAGQWQALVEDTAGQALLDTLRLQPGAEYEFADIPRRMDQQAFVAWASQALEAASFLPPHPLRPQVVILPASQLLGRVLTAVVFPGCDEVRLPASPETPGAWTSAQRLQLGLAQRDQLAQLARAAWQYALCSPHIDVLWRASEAGERLMPSPFVQELMLHKPGLALDPRVARSLRPKPGAMPRPSGADLPVVRLSASAYEDLRRCPYRFFALRQLRLQESDELDNELGKRDFGNWLHALLRHFHEALASTPTALSGARRMMIDAAADRAAQELGLAQSEFLPFAASWPRVRASYLKWLDDHEATGASFVQAEASKEMRLGVDLTLAGRIDRVDHLADGSALVIDYKTEARAKTTDRIKHPGEDTQLAFYAALLPDDTLAAMYLNLGELQATHAYRQPGIVELRDQLVMGIQDDMRRIASGASMPALGEGSACDFCAARGLCRKDFWESDSGAPLPSTHEAAHV
jgi:ATP-dependent helicase/nuclease subunit B